MNSISKIGLSLDDQDSSPRYVQLAKAIERAVNQGHFQPNDALPSERALADGLGVSRVTARAAIDQLADQGIIIRKRGSGNYVAPRIEQTLTYLTGFSEELSQRGFKPSTRWIDRSTALATVDQQHRLGLPADSYIALLERLRLADGVVVAYEVTAIPAQILPDPSSVDDSLYQHLQKTRNTPMRAVQHIRAVNATQRLAEQLHIPVGQALLFITRIGYLASNQAVELTHSYCRSDYYEFVAEMRRKP